MEERVAQEEAAGTAAEDDKAAGAAAGTGGITEPETTGTDCVEELATAGKTDGISEKGTAGNPGEGLGSEIGKEGIESGELKRLGRRGWRKERI